MSRFCDFCNKKGIDYKTYGYINRPNKMIVKVHICRECMEKEGDKVFELEGDYEGV